VPDFYSLPDDYQRLLITAQERYGIEVVPLEELRGGRTGALLYLVSVSTAGTSKVKHFVLKFDHVNAKARMGEIQRHNQALSQAPGAFARQHMAEIAFEIEEDGAVAIFYTIAGQSLHHFRPLANYERQSQLETLFQVTTEYLLEEWNAELTFEQAIHPRLLLDRWLGYRLKPGSHIERFLDDTCLIAHDMEGLLIQGKAYPNPLAYGQDADKWGQARPIDAISGFQHGDLNIGNILAKFAANNQDLAGYFLIDFALFKGGMPLLYDQRYLELSFLLRELERASFGKWVELVTRLATFDTPEPKKVPVELAGSCAVINAGRISFRRWVQESHASLADDLWGQFWLAGVAVGLNYCNKAALPERERMAALIFATAHLQRYCSQFDIQAPADVRRLIDDSDGWGVVQAKQESIPTHPAALVPDFPTGRVTFLFTDIVGSTTLWETLPKQMAIALNRHNALLEQAVSAQGGYIFKRLGDAFCIAFSSAAGALLAAAEGQRLLSAETWAETGPLLVRMALHSGAAIDVEGDYLGPAVNRVARLLDVTYGGQILFTQATLEGARERLSPDFSWLDLGQHYLKDLNDPEGLLQLIVPGLPAEFPPLPTVSIEAKHLPRQATSLVGRQFELAEIIRLLESHRLVTISGPGGIGKTRLALAVAEAQESHLRQGAYFVSLLPIDSPTAITPAIADEVGLTFLEGRDPQDQLLDYLRSRQILLVLDNLEHLLAGDGSGDDAQKTLALIEVMLAAAPGLKILVTSREVLRLPDERTYSLSGLPLGDETVITGSSADDAAELFCLRAQRAQSTFKIETDEDHKNIQQLCRLVEGMPLAIELAAAQLRLLSLVEITAEIKRSLDVLDTGIRGASARHGSVRVVLDASWKALKPAEQLLFARLSVFRGSFTKDAAAHVVQASVVDLAALLDKSLIRKTAGDRFILHALTQMFAAEKLTEMPGEMAQTQTRHYRYYRQLLLDAVSRWLDGKQPGALEIIRQDVDDLRAGWRWILEQEEWGEVALYLDNLWQFFKVRGRLPEIMELLNQALHAGQTAAPAADIVYQAHWERRLGQAYLWMSQMTVGDEHFRQVLVLLGWPLPHGQTGLIMGILGQILAQVLHRSWPSYFIGRLEHKQAAFQEAFIAYEGLAERAVVENESLLSIYGSLRSLNLAEAAELRPMMARAYATTSYIFGLIPWHWAALAYINRAVSLIQGDSSAYAREGVFRFAAFYYGGVGQLARAEDYCLQGAEAAAELGQHWVLEFNWVGIILTTYYQGKYDRSLEFASRIADSAGRRGDISFVAAAHYWLAVIKLRQGADADEIAGLLLESFSAPSEGMNVFDWLTVYASLSQAYWRCGRQEAALEEVKKASELVAGFSRPTNVGNIVGYTGVADVYLAMWEKTLDSRSGQDIQNLARQACRDLTVYAKVFAIAKPSAYLYQGLYDYISGDPKKAQKAWQSSLIHAREFSMPYEEARAHYTIGRHLNVGQTTEERWGRQEHLQSAAEIFTGLGAAYDLDKTNQELDK
jgi:predicted ATPase/class 3 adenylate cyclase